LPDSPVVAAAHLRKVYRHSRGKAEHVAVADLSFTLAAGASLGIVGESGAGKSTVAKLLMGMETPSAGSIRIAGSVRAGGRASRSEQRRRAREIQMVFQDPASSLDPRMTVGQIVEEPFVIHKLYSREERLRKVQELLDAVGMDPHAAGKYPHQFSGGQRQRIGIARALALNPKLIVADEPVSALDVSIQAQIVNLMQDLQTRYGLTYLFISHGLPVVEHISDRIGVMYLGRIVETGLSDEICRHPLHPYTQILLSSVPSPDPGIKRETKILAGDVPSPVNPPPGCRFHTRCPYVMDRCKVEEPKEIRVSATHQVWCHLVEAPSLTQDSERS
jgi:oligopeptide transport system ATP-binding protein